MPSPEFGGNGKFCFRHLPENVREAKAMEQERAAACEGCRRHALDPKWTLRFWARESPCSPRHVGRWMHVDPSGVAYDCTAPDALVPEDDEVPDDGE